MTARVEVPYAFEVSSAAADFRPQGNSAEVFNLITSGPHSAY